MSTFYTCSIIWTHHKIVSQLSPPIFNHYHIETSYDTIQSLKILWSKYFIFFSWLFCKLTYSFVAIDFWCSPKHSDFPLYISTYLANFVGIFMWDFKWKGSKQKDICDTHQILWNIYISFCAHSFISITISLTINTNRIICHVYKNSQRNWTYTSTITIFFVSPHSVNTIVQVIKGRSSASPENII